MWDRKGVEFVIAGAAGLAIALGLITLVSATDEQPAAPETVTVRHEGLRDLICVDSKAWLSLEGGSGPWRAPGRDGDCR